MTLSAAELQRDATILDGLVFYSDGDASSLKAAHVDAVNLTISHFEADFEETADQVAGWLARFQAPDSEWMLIEKVADLHRARAAGKVGVIMGWQNMRPIGDKLERLAFFHRLGLRIMQLTYNRRNFLGDGCLEPEDGGLSGLGRMAIARMNELGIALDLSHVGERTAREAAEASRQPVLLTHANARVISKALRNKGDAVLKATAATGGVIGCSIYGPMCWSGDASRPPSIDDFLKHLDYIAGLVGIAHVGIGTDLPAVSDLGKVKHITEMTLSRFPAAIADYARAFGNDIRGRYIAEVKSHVELVKITEALLKRGWKEHDVRELLGGNFLRALAKIWGG
jgi:membrane dipeptidase